MSNIQTVKASIKTELDTLVTATTLAAAVTQEVKEDPFKNDYPAYPIAVLTPPSIESTVLDNATNLRTYEFGVVLIFKPENLESTTELEQTIEAVLNHFDDHVTLDGVASGGVEPAASAPAPLDYMGKQFIVAEVMLRVSVPRTISRTGQ